MDSTTKRPASAAINGKRKASQLKKKKSIEKPLQKKRQTKPVVEKELTKMQQRIKEAGEEEIDSDEIDTNSVGSQDGRTNAERLAEFDEENEDRKRVRLAQQILKATAKKSKKADNKQAQQATALEVDSDSFDDGEDSGSDGDSFKGVIHAEAKHQDAITRALQNDILKKRQLVFTHFADKVLKSLQKSSTLSTLKGHTRCITSLQFCPVTSHLYSASKDASIIRWELLTDASPVKTFLVREKTPDAHKDEVLSMSVNHLGKYLVTGSKDKSIKLWDMKKMSLVQTFAGHKQAVNGVKFGINSNTFCSISLDRQFKMWDATDKAFIDTFFGHKAEVNSIDAVSGENFLSCGFDRQVIVWKTEHQSQLIYAGHDYSIDVVKAVDSEHFITASQDGSIALWSVKKKKPVFIEKKPHGDNWVTALGNLYNTDVFFSGSSDNKINAYKIDLAKKTFAKIFEIPCTGVINDIQLSVDCSILAFSECDEHRLGRWIVSPKTKNVIKYLRFA